MWWQVVARDPPESQSCSSVQNASMLHPFFAHLATKHEAFEGTSQGGLGSLSPICPDRSCARSLARTWPPAKVQSVRP